MNEPGTAVTKREDFSLSDIQSIGGILAASKLFNVKTEEQAIALCLIAHAEGTHPAMAAMDYDIIQGTPALKSNALLARFQAAGGSVDWSSYEDDNVTGVFSHPQGGSVTITWDMDRAKQAGLGGKDNWKKWPRQMMRARCISEGVRTVWPGAAKLYVPEEVMDFDKVPEKNITSEGTASESPAAAADTKPEATGKKPTAKGESERTAAAKAKIKKAQEEAAKRKKAAEAAAAEAPKAEEPEVLPPEENAATNDFPEAEGAIVEDTSKLEAAFAKYDVDVPLLEKWRGLPKEKWTESVVKDLRGLFLSFKNDGMTKDNLVEILAEEF